MTPPKKGGDEPTPGPAPEIEPGMDAFAMFEALDPAGFAEAWTKAATAAMSNPDGVADAWGRYWSGMVEATAAAVDRSTGEEAAGPVQPGRKDRRFRDPAWEENPAYFGLLQAYLLAARLVDDLRDASTVDAVTDERIGFLSDVIVGAAAPTNFFWANPSAVKRALDTGGSSVARGMRTFADDLANNQGMPRQIDPDAFAVARDLAVTPGKVVYRNELMELIQYEPATETVHETPLLMSPPWINKYYIMDLAPGRSFVQWAVEHGHTTFAISYRNPDESHRHVSLDDYLLSGPISALDAIREITGAERANIVGLCLGGTLTAALEAYLASRGEDRIASTTLLNTLVDFSRPGRLGAFTDEASIERLERRMNERGYLEAAEMMGVFTFMRSNDLVWNYAVNNWLMGEDPQPFDILAWNADSTRMPANMHSFYLRSCYLNNELASGTMELDGVRLDLADVRGDHYILGAIEDHIAPWEGSYLTTQVLPAANSRYVLSAAGHIAGIVNPPSPKAWFRTAGDCPADPREWFEASTRREGSWWEDWADWIAARSGERVPPPGMGSAEHPPLDDAPGRYVLER
ncbi:MAG: PHA/PHB synthase family protein [Thermoleophilia bacterium]